MIQVTDSYYYSIIIIIIVINIFQKFRKANKCCRFSSLRLPSTSPQASLEFDGEKKWNELKDRK